MWKRLLIQLLHFDEYLTKHGLTALEMQQQLFATLRDECDQSFIKFWPLLNSFVPLRLPENSSTKDLGSMQRNLHTRNLIKHLLHRRAKQRPLVVLLEDFQFSDPASLELAYDVAAELTDSLYLVIATRPLNPVPEKFTSICSLPNANVLHLKAMLPQECARIVCVGLGIDELPPAVQEEINKAEGNPFFSEELVRGLVDSNSVEITHDGKLVVTGDVSSVEIPDTVQGLISSRIDRLPAAPQMVLKVGMLKCCEVCSTVLDVSLLFGPLYGMVFGMCAVLLLHQRA